MTKETRHELRRLILSVISAVPSKTCRSATCTLIPYSKRCYSLKIVLIPFHELLESAREGFRERISKRKISSYCRSFNQIVSEKNTFSSEEVQKQKANHWGAREARERLSRRLPERGVNIADKQAAVLPTTVRKKMLLDGNIISKRMRAERTLVEYRDKKQERQFKSASGNLQMCIIPKNNPTRLSFNATDVAFLHSVACMVLPLFELCSILVGS